MCCLEILGTSTSWGPKGLFMPVMVHLYLYLLCKLEANETKELPLYNITALPVTSHVACTHVRYATSQLIVYKHLRLRYDGIHNTDTKENHAS
jgi:hypothetical protein